MAFFNFKFDLLKIDEKMAASELKAIKLEMLQDALKAFVIAAALRIPVDTGMAKGSLLAIAKVAGMALEVSGNYYGTRMIKGKTVKLFYKKKYQYSPAKDKYKSPQLGKSLTSVKVKNTKDITSVTINANIFHLTLNDLLGTSKVPGSPWKAFEAGRKAMFDSLRTSKKLEEFSIKRCLLKSRLSVGLGGVSRTAWYRDPKNENKFKPQNWQRTIDND